MGKLASTEDKSHGVGGGWVLRQVFKSYWERGKKKNFKEKNCGGLDSIYS